MNFLNPFALLGLAAASIPLLLHLLNLRRMRTVEFSTVRFLQELQQTRVRRLKLQQLLLLILRTLLIVFAVLAFARPTIPSKLPLLSSTARSSVVIVVDNSGSMEATDQNGERLRQAKDQAKRIVSMLNDGDEVCVLPMAGVDPFSTVGFTRTFQQADAQIDAIELSSEQAITAQSLHSADRLMRDAEHAHREVFVISDAQSNTMRRLGSDTGYVLTSDATVFMVPIGKGTQGLEQNIAIDSVRLLTQLPQVDRPIEVEAYIRNCSSIDATGVLVSMATHSARVAQRAIDIPSGETRSIILSAPAQRSGLIPISIELEKDAMQTDNKRFIGVAIPPPVRVAVIGNGLPASIVRSVLSLPLASASIGAAQVYATVQDVAPLASALDVIVLVNPAITSSEIPILTQFVQRGGGLVVFASDEPGLAQLLDKCNVQTQGVKEAGQKDHWTIKSIDEKHPLLEGVFKAQRERSTVESPSIQRQLVVSNGVAIATSDVGPFLTESVLGAGRVIVYGVAVDAQWGSFIGTGLFPATLVRSVIYLNAPYGSSVLESVGQPITIAVPSRYQGEAQTVVRDVTGASFPVAVTQHASGSSLSIAAQPLPGVVSVSTADSVVFAALGINAPASESELTYLDAQQWLTSAKSLVKHPDHVVVAEGRDVVGAVQSARLGSELWPLCIVLALACAVAESLIARYGASEQGNKLA